MEQQPINPEPEQPELNALGKIVAQLFQYGHNAQNNLGDAFGKMSMKDWIRLVIIVGGYMLLRPYVLKHATKVGVKKLEAEEAKAKAKAELSPNDLRGQGGDEAEDDAVGDGTGVDWGQKARVRQRQVLQQLMEAEEKRRLDEEDLKDIEDLLED